MVRRYQDIVRGVSSKETSQLNETDTGRYTGPQRYIGPKHNTVRLIDTTKDGYDVYHVPGHDRGSNQFFKVKHLDGTLRDYSVHFGLDLPHIKPEHRVDQWSKGYHELPDHVKEIMAKHIKGEYDHKLWGQYYVPRTPAESKSLGEAADNHNLPDDERFRAIVRRRHAEATREVQGAENRVRAFEKAGLLKPQAKPEKLSPEHEKLVTKWVNDFVASAKREYEASLKEQTSVDEKHVANMAGVKGKDALYGIDMGDDAWSRFEKASKSMVHSIAHIKRKGYKVNHAFGDEPIDGMPYHKNPDITLHYEDDPKESEPVGYTVHHKGEAAYDKSLHKKGLLYGHANPKALMGHDPI